MNENNLFGTNAGKRAASRDKCLGGLFMLITLKAFSIFLFYMTDFKE